MGGFLDKPTEKKIWRLASPTNPSKFMSQEMAEAYESCLLNAAEACAGAPNHGVCGGFRFSCKFPLESDGGLDPDAIAFQAVVVAAYRQATDHTEWGTQNGWIKHDNDADGEWHVRVGRFDGNNSMLKLMLTPEDILKLANAEAFDRWIQHQWAKLEYPPVPEKHIDDAPRVRQTWGRPPPPESAAAPAVESAAAAQATPATAAAKST